jgi:hypothetical protein
MFLDANPEQRIGLPLTLLEARKHSGVSHTINAFFLRILYSKFGSSTAFMIRASY